MYILAHCCQIRHTKILTWLNPEVQSLAKDMDFSVCTSPTYSVRELSRRTRSVWTQSASSRGPLQQNLSQRLIWGGSSQTSGTRRSRYQAQARYQPYNQNQRAFGPRRTFSKTIPKVRINEQYFKQSSKKQFCFCSYKHLHTCITCCKLFNKKQFLSQYFQSPTQFNFPVGSGKACTQQSSRGQQLNRSLMHGINQLEANNIRPLGFRGNTSVKGQILEATIPGTYVCQPHCISQKDAQLMNTEVLKLIEISAIVVVDSPHTHKGSCPECSWS